MLEARSCSVGELHRGGRAIAMIPWGSESGWRATRRCGDCGVQPGSFHHPGCDMQECPICHGQMITCGCRFDEDGPLDDDEDDSEW